MNKKDQQFIAQKIRTQYMAQDNSEKELDMLRKLDAEVKRPANVFGYVFGSVGAIVMGAGMSLVMTDIGAQIGIENTMFPGIALGIVGMAIAIINYPIYKKILSNRRTKYADKIITLSESIMTKEEN